MNFKRGRQARDLTKFGTTMTLPSDRTSRCLLPDEPLPAYAHVPGHTPHPLSNPAGHSYGSAVDISPLDPPCWKKNRTYLRGLDLFNHGYYWEAHEAWEGLWKAAEPGATRDFLKGLIQLAVAGVKRMQGLPDGVRIHARRAAELWSSVDEKQYLGFEVPALVALAERIARDGWPGVAPLFIPNRDEADV